MTTHIIYETAGRAFLPDNRFVSIVIHRIHLLIAEGTVSLVYHQSTVTDTLVAVYIYINQFDVISCATVYHCPEIAVSIALSVIAESREICSAGSQYGIVSANGHNALDFHVDPPPLVSVI
jgi:hypothetical protein